RFSLITWERFAIPEKRSCREEEAAVRGRRARREPLPCVDSRVHMRDGPRRERGGDSIRRSDLISSFPPPIIFSTANIFPLPPGEVVSPAVLPFRRSTLPPDAPEVSARFPVAPQDRIAASRRRRPGWGLWRIFHRWDLPALSPGARCVREGRSWTSPEERWGGFHFMNSPSSSRSLFRAPAGSTRRDPRVPVFHSTPFIGGKHWKL
ncbi:MAG: hypothetical protein H6R41_1177, partial [Deltaproteobacteria bacterium]|nr:hypothetical protein [Deltaproteobacteria bacterium]MBS1244640.1 hypothetical protein [Deltaproteobacteria bacterium]